MKTVALALVFGMSFGSFGCTHDGGKIKSDTMQYDKDKKQMVPLIEYRAPDYDELTGIDPDEVKPAEPAPTTTSEAAAPPVATPPAATTPAAAAKPATPPATKPATPAKK